MEPSEKNTREAFVRSFRAGFGTETDLRDRAGSLVISHDPAGDGVMAAAAFFDLYQEVGDGLPLALNIKSDGLQPMLEEVLAEFGVRNYFVFDMSVPDTLPYLRDAFHVFTRQSEYEPDPPLYDRATGVWVDCFETEWITRAQIERHLEAGKRVCLVSPDLHKRPYRPFWEALRDWETGATDRLLLCTDHPDEAQEYFHGH